VLKLYHARMVGKARLVDRELDHGEGDNRPTKQGKDKPARDSLILALQAAYVRGEALGVRARSNWRSDWPHCVGGVGSGRNGWIAIDVVGRHERRLPRWCDVPNRSAALEPYK
jgi:hypothetical protein